MGGDAYEYPCHNFKWYKTIARSQPILEIKNARKIGVRRKNLNREVYESFRGSILNLPTVIFRRLMTRIFEDVFKDECIFKLPEKQGFIRPYYSSRNVFMNKALKKSNKTEIGKKTPIIRIEYTLKSKPDVVLRTIKLIPVDYALLDYRDQIRKNKHPYDTQEVRSLGFYMKYLYKEFYDVPRNIIRNVVARGFRMFKLFNYLGLSIIFARYIGSNSGEPKFKAYKTETKGYRYKRDQKREIKHLTKTIAKITSYYDVAIRKARYEGWHYCALTEEEHEHLLTHKFVKQLSVYMTRVMQKPTTHPYIIAVKTHFDIPKTRFHTQSNIKKSLLNRLRRDNPNTLQTIFKKEITYERGSIKYLWRWDGSRFRAFDNSQLRLNSLSEWYNDDVQRE